MYFKKRPTALQCWRQPRVSDGTALYPLPPPSQDIWTAPHPHLFSFTTENVSLAPPHTLKHQLKLQEGQRLEHPCAQVRHEAGRGQTAPGSQHCRIGHRQRRACPGTLCSQQLLVGRTALKGNQWSREELWIALILSKKV